MLPLFPPADCRRCGAVASARAALSRTVRLAAPMAALVMAIWPAMGQSQELPPGPGLAVAPLPEGPLPGLLPPEAVPEVLSPAAELPPPWQRGPCLASAMSPNPALPPPLLPDPLLPPPEVIPQTYCDGPFGCEGPPAACPPRRWLVRAGAVFLNRSDVFAQPLLFRSVPQQALEFDADDFEFDLEAGPLVDLMFLSPLGWQLEARHFSVATWNSRHGFPDIVQFPVGRLLFDDTNLSGPVNRPSLKYESDLYSTEFNFRRPVAPWLVPMIGFRWVELQEEYAAAAHQRPSRFAETDALNYATHNHMYGLQLGTEMRLFDRGGPLRIDSTILAGIYYNEADLRASRATSQLVRQTDGTWQVETLRRGVSHEEAHTSFLGEITLGATWQVRKCLAVRGGWQLLWLEGVALAPEQLATTTLGDPTVATSSSRAATNTDGSAFYHGPFTSLELIW